MYKIAIIAAMLIGKAMFLNAQDTLKIDANLKHANVYYGYGAELTHDCSALVNSKTKIIKISNLSINALDNTLQISVPAKVTLLSYHYIVETKKNTLITKALDYQKQLDSISNYEKEMDNLSNLIAIEKEILEQTGKLVSNTVEKSGNKTITSDEVLKLVNYYNTKIATNRNNIYNYTLKINDVAKRITKIKNNIAEPIAHEEAKIADKQVGVLLLQVMVKDDGSIPISFSYFTNNAGWTPTYDFRVNSKTNKVTLGYKASIAQTTGINWDGVKLSLSTGTPDRNSEAPILTAMYAQLYLPEIYKAMRANAQTNLKNNYLQTLSSKDINADLKNNAEVIITGFNSIKQKPIDQSTIQNFVNLQESQLNTTYEIDLPYDIVSDGQLNTVAIKDEEVDALLKNYSVPRVKQQAYLMAEIANWENLDLLPGEVNIIMDDVYLGKTVLDANSSNDTLNITLGTDRRIVVKRSAIKEYTSTKINGESTKQTFTYEIVVKNNKQTEVNLLLKDLYPLSSVKDIEIKLVDDGGATINSELGILNWKMVLKPNEQKKVRFTYTVKYPTNKKIINIK